MVPFLQECFNIVVSKVCGVSAPTPRQIGAAILRMTEMTLVLQQQSIKEGINKETRSKATLFQPFLQSGFYLLALLAVVAHTGLQTTKSIMFPLNARLSHSVYSRHT